MSRLRSNCSTIEVEPRKLVEVISVSPAMRPKDLSSGVATDDAIVSGLAPGRLACTWMVGNSTSGNGATGNKRNAIAPANAIAIVNSVVPTELRMKVSERLISPEREESPFQRPRAELFRTPARGDRNREKSPAWCIA